LRRRKTSNVWSRRTTIAASALIGLGLGVGLTLQSAAEPRAVKRPKSEISSEPVRSNAIAAAASGAVLTPVLFKLRAQAQARILGAGRELEDATGAVRRPPAKLAHRVNGNALGVFVPVENESALGAFHAALAKLEANQLPGGKLRILAYGASHTQADVYTSYLRHYLQSRFGDGGLGFVQMAKLDKRYHTQALQVESSGFNIEHAQRAAYGTKGWFGLLGAAAVASSPGAFGSIRQNAERRSAMGPVELDVYAMGHERAGGLRLFIDGMQQATWSTKSANPKLVVHSAASPSGFTEATVKPVGDRGVRLYGVSVERPTPGVVVDTLGISGTRAANWLTWDEGPWAEQVQRRHPYLITLAYGTNETSDEHQPIERYERELDRVLTRLKRAAPQASCLLIGPADVAKKQKGAWVERRRLKHIIEVQRRQASLHGCGFWDTRRFMGDGGIARWVRAAPQMASADHVHLTRRGYVKLGLVLGDALLRAYDHKRAQKQPIASSE
jgi:lysophospholipase L1-like esterase